MDVDSWIDQQVADGYPMSALWDALLSVRWRENIAAAQQHLRSLTLSEVLTVARNGSQVSNEDLLRQWDMDDAGVVHLLHRLLAPAASCPDPEARALLDKLRTLAAERMLPLAGLLVEVLSGPGAASLIAKNPSKQSLYEPAAVRYLTAATGHTVVRLSTRGISLRFRADGTWLTAGREPDATKSADLAIVATDGTTGRLYLCAHKYARVAGGHQDNQLADARNFMQYARIGRAGSAALPVPLQELADTEAPEISTWDWRPGLVLDGSFFAPQLARLRREQRHNLERVGSTDDWARWLSGAQSSVVAGQGRTR